MQSGVEIAADLYLLATNPFAAAKIVAQTPATSIPNLFLAGAHTRTAADVWSIEAAVESGRRAAQAIHPGVKVIPQYKPLWLRAISSIDDVCFGLGGPHVLDLLLWGLPMAAAVALGLWVYPG